MDLMTLAGIITAVATSLYTFFFLFALWFAYIQTRGFEKNRKLQVVLAIFQELQTTSTRGARKNLYTQVPTEISSLGDEDLEKYLEITQTAIMSLDRIGYIIKEGHMDPESILILCWALVWRSWKKSENIINWVREKRGEPTYLHYFKYLFDLSEAYRIENNLRKPKFY